LKLFGPFLVALFLKAINLHPRSEKPAFPVTSLKTPQTGIADIEIAKTFLPGSLGRGWEGTQCLKLQEWQPEKKWAKMKKYPLSPQLQTSAPGRKQRKTG
jgi:hypothetical protein